MWWNDGSFTNRMGQANRYSQALTKFHGTNPTIRKCKLPTNSTDSEKRRRFRQLALSDEQKAANLELCEPVDSFDSEVTQLKNEIEQLQADIKTLESIVRQAKSERQSLEAESTRLKSECERWSCESDSLSSQLAQSVDDRIELARQFEIARAELQELRYLHRPRLRLSQPDSFEFPASRSNGVHSARKAA